MSGNAGTIPWLKPGASFPPSSQALENPPGLLAAGGDLSIATLRKAYQQGIFPWFNASDPILWWSPAPRMILKPADFHISHSLKKRLKQIATHQARGNFDTVIKVDTAFAQVLQACASTPRDGQSGTWINAAMQQAYQAWHACAEVHSIETWQQGELTGGLYGVSLGCMFFGESMFSHRTDASKLALAHLIYFLNRQGVTMIDCQMHTEHLQSLGAHLVPRKQFLLQLEQAVALDNLGWHAGWIDSSGVLNPL